MLKLITTNIATGLSEESLIRHGWLNFILLFKMWSTHYLDNNILGVVNQISSLKSI